MKKIFSLLFVLISVNCFAIAYELEEILYDKDDYVNNYNESTHRFVIVIDKLEGTQNPTQKEILKVTLAIEASLLEKKCMSTIKLLQNDIENYKKQISKSTSESQKECFLNNIQKFEDIITLYQDRLRIVHQITDELTHY